MLFYEHNEGKLSDTKQAKTLSRLENDHHAERSIRLFAPHLRLNLGRLFHEPVNFRACKHLPFNDRW